MFIKFPSSFPSCCFLASSCSLLCKFQPRILTKFALGKSSVHYQCITFIRNDGGNPILWLILNLASKDIVVNASLNDFLHRKRFFISHLMFYASRKISAIVYRYLTKQVNLFIAQEQHLPVRWKPLKTLDLTCKI